GVGSRRARTGRRARACRSDSVAPRLERNSLMLTWGVVFALAVGVYGQRALGAVAVDTNRVGARWRRVLDALPITIIAAVVALQTFSASGELTVDARVAGVGAAAICAWRRLPMMVTVLVAAAVTAGLRAWS
ncbi:MAG: AzlD domain-containing protein, partial [Acidimicrobiales bacterium]